MEDKIKELESRIAVLETAVTTQSAKIDTLIETVNCQSDKLTDLYVRTEIKKGTA